MPHTYVATEDLLDRVVGIFRKAGLSGANADAVAGIIVAAEADECKSHGIYRIEGCLRAISAGKVDPVAIPNIVRTAAPVVEVNALGGFSHPAFLAASETLVRAARECGLAALVIRDGLHFSALWHEVEFLAAQGLASLSMCPSYAFVAPFGGRKGLLGTNPLAFGWPRAAAHPYVFDFATSVAARGEIELHRQAGEPIPEGWAIDSEGRPTTDPSAALQGAMLPFGAHKGSAISTMIELLSGAMIGEFTSRQALDFMGGGGSLLPRHGALVLAMDPTVFSRSIGRNPIAEGDALLSAISAQGARLPSERRYAARARSATEGIRLTEAECAMLDRLYSANGEASW